MAVAKVQGATGNGATIVLNGCTAGNALIYQNSFFRASGTGVGEATPADSNGTFSVSRADVPALFTSNELGVGIFHQQNINAGTHTVTPQANTETHVSLTEFSGLSTTGLFVTGSANSNKTSPEVSGLVSQGTGATSTAAVTGDLAVITFCDAGSPGAANIGLTDPVSGYTTLQLANDDLTSVARQHGFQVLGSGGTKSATFNWTDSASNRSAHAAIATFVAASGAVLTAPLMPAFIWGRSKFQLARPHVDANASVLNNYILAAATGVYTFAGSAAKTTRAAILAAATGTYNLTGISALTAWGHKLLANTGVFVLTGSSASVLATRVLAAIKGTFTLTGNAAATLYKRIMIANTGSFTLTGNPSTVVRTYVLNAAKGIFSLTGVAASTIYSAGASVVSDWLIQFRRRRR